MRIKPEDHENTICMIRGDQPSLRDRLRYRETARAIDEAEINTALQYACAGHRLSGTRPHAVTLSADTTSLH